MSHYDDSDAAGREDRRYGGRQGSGRQGSRRGSRKRHSPGLVGGGVVAGIVALALVAGSLAFYAKYREIWDSIKRVDVSSDLAGVKQPPADPHALNILLIGSDSRSGGNAKIGGYVAGQRSDTVMVLHISPGAHRAVVLSFPRDSVVPIYSCTAEGGTQGQTQDTSQVEQINATFADGGPGCLWKTLELSTHIHLNNFVEMTFVGFEKIIDDLGGVDVCLPTAVDDPMSGLHLAAGKHHIYGSQALAFWRTREDLGMGSDLQRIQRDQFLMVALLQGIEKSGLLTSTTKLSKVIGDVADHMTTDKGLTLDTMLKIAQSMHGLSSKSVQFIEVPTVNYPENPDWVQWTSTSDQLFSAIAHDTKLPKTSKAKKTTPATLDAISPAKVKVDVLNGSGLAGGAGEGAADLTSRGFDVTGSGNASNYNYTDSVVEYHSAADHAAAEVVKKEMSDVEILANPSVPAGTIDLILGSDFTELKPLPTNTGSSDLTKTYGGITGNTNVCNDGSAFAGPDGS
ncbi:MAG TPA: LCP family protein [Streptosporangiaceae bacterium]